MHLANPKSVANKEKNNIVTHAHNHVNTCDPALVMRVYARNSEHERVRMNRSLNNKVGCTCVKLISGHDEINLTILLREKEIFIDIHITLIANILTAESAGLLARCDIKQLSRGPPRI